MAVKVWFVRDGPEPTRGGPAYELPLESCIEKLGLRHWLSGPDQTPRFGDQSSQLGEIAGYSHVVCEIDEAEAAESGRVRCLGAERSLPR